LAAADVLRRAGVQVTVYDRYDRAGGLLTYGIPGFKLEKPVVMQRIAQLETAGVQLVLNCRVGEDLSFDAIRGRHDAVLIASGVYKSRDISAPGVGAQGVVKALDYLTASNRKSFGDDVAEFDSGELNAEGKRVVVIGGGDTAMDCVRTAIRQGAVSVKCLYRRDKANMPGSQREVQNAEEEGVDFVWLSAPKGFTGGAVVNGVIVQKMRLGAPDATGRQVPEVIEDADYTEAADLVKASEAAASDAIARAGDATLTKSTPHPLGSMAGPVETGEFAGRSSQFTVYANQVSTVTDEEVEQ
jgi:glutamate synthase (NADPH/NADH) small chain